MKANPDALKASQTECRNPSPLEPTRMTSILIVNDDGTESPMLPRMAEKLSPLGTVRIAVPDSEQSWKGKAMTRFGRIKVRPLEGMGVEAFAIGGTPSDCANLAVHQLLPEPPDWIVSGINIGVNAGTAFILSSGTVGAAIEGAIQGIPSVAFSTYLEPPFFMEWLEHQTLNHPDAMRVVDSTTTRMAEMMGRLIPRGLPQGAMMLNINFPGAVDSGTPVRWVPIQTTRYGGIFRPDGDAFIHAASIPLEAEDNGDSDRSVLQAGAISVTPLSLLGLSMRGDHEFPL